MAKALRKQFAFRLPNLLFLTPRSWRIFDQSRDPLKALGSSHPYVLFPFAFALRNSFTLYRGNGKVPELFLHQTIKEQ